MAITLRVYAINKDTRGDMSKVDMSWGCLPLEIVKLAQWIGNSGRQNFAGHLRKTPARDCWFTVVDTVELLFGFQYGDAVFQ